jgi:hypothetical protein
MPERLILVIAQRYGQSPAEVERWEEWWLNRAIIELEAEGELKRREIERLKKKDKARR